MGSAVESLPNPTRSQEFWAGVRAISPLILGAIPFGIIFGAVAVTSGLSPGAAAAMSAIVFAGSAQFVAAGMVSVGAGLWVIIATTFVVNLRHALYATSLAPTMRHLPQRWLIPLGFWLTDESYVVVIRRYMRGDASPFKHWFYLGTAVTMYTNWQLCTWIGILAGQSIANPRAWGLDFALPVTFIGMLIPMLDRRSVVWSASAAGLTSVLLRTLPNHLGLVTAALVGIVVGVLLDRQPASQPARRVAAKPVEPARRSTDRSGA